MLKTSRSGKELGELRDGQRQKIEKISAFIFQALKKKLIEILSQARKAY